MVVISLSFSRNARIAPSFRRYTASKITAFYMFINFQELLMKIIYNFVIKDKNANLKTTKLKLQ